MSSVAAKPDSHTGPSGPRAVRVTDATLPSAVARLLGVRLGDPAAIDFIEQSRREGANISMMWMTQLPSGRAAHAVLASPGSGRTAMMFVSGDDVVGVKASAELSRLIGTGAIKERGELIDFACRDIRDMNARGEIALALAQALLEPGQKELIASFEAAGFTRLADLAYLRRDVPRKPLFDEPTWPRGVRVHTLSSLPPAEGESLLRDALTRSYEGTLDCPALCDLRTIEDVVNSHRSVGEYDPRLWFILTIDGAGHGCLLLTPCPDQSTIELVYIGLGPAARGKGLAAALMQMGMNRVAGRREKFIACAVDESNTPALRLYSSLRFKPFTHRVALVRGLEHP